MDIVPIKSQVEALSLSLSLSLSVPLSKIGTRLLASLGSKEKNRNSLACLRNAGSYSADFVVSSHGPRISIGRRLPHRAGKS